MQKFKNGDLVRVAKDLGLAILQTAEASGSRQGERKWKYISTLTSYLVTMEINLTMSLWLTQ